MKFLADECCDAAMVYALRDDGHDVLYAIESLRGASDEVLLSLAFREERIILTEDKDFGELVYRLRKPTYGVILLRFEVENCRLKVPRMRVLLAESSQRLTSSFVVLEADKIRLRPFPEER